MKVLTLALGLPVCTSYLLWGLKDVNRTYFGVAGDPGLELVFSERFLRVGGGAIGAPVLLSSFLNPQDMDPKQGP